MAPFGVVGIGSCRAEQKRGGTPSLASGLLPAGAGAVEDLEHWLEDVRRTVSRLDSKRATLEGQIAAASRGRRRAPRRAQAVPAPLPPAHVDDHDAACSYTRKGAVRRRLRAAAGGVKKERERLESLLGDLEEAVVDARERLALEPSGN